MLLLNKYLKIKLQLTIAVLFLFKNTFAQNLVQNGSFESYEIPLNCNGGGGFYDISVFPPVLIVYNWDVKSSPDYYNTVCNDNGEHSAPSNIFGYAIPKQGNAYGGFIAYAGANNEIKEYIYQQLSIPLQAGKVYCLSFNVTLADVSNGAIKQVGAYFSNTLPNYVNNHIVANAQIENTHGFITDTLNWTSVQGCFTAQGGETYMLFGNFHDNATTDTIAVNTNYTMANGIQRYSYYYIDDVSLVEDTSTGIDEIKGENKVNVWPNPAKDVLNITVSKELLTERNTEIKIYNAVGELVLRESLATQNSSINIHYLQSSIYFYHILVNDKLIKSNKLVVIK